MSKNSTLGSVGRIALALSIVLTTASSVSAALATWDANKEPDVAGYKLSYGTQSGVHPVTVDVGNVTTYQFNPPAGARYYVVVQAYNTYGELSEKSAEATIDVPAPSPPTANKAPELAAPPDQSSTRDSSVVLALKGSDPDGTMLQFSAGGLPAGLSLNPTSGLISGVVSQTGTFQVTVAVSDGFTTTSGFFTWTVTDPAAPMTVVDLSPTDTTLMVDGFNYDAAPWLKAHTKPANRVAGAIVMKFNLSAIPANATIHSAILNLSLTGVDYKATDTNYRVSLHQIVNRDPNVGRATGRIADTNKPWTGNPCCQDGIPLAQADISPVQSATLIDRTLGFKTWEAAAAVRAWVATPSTNFGLLLNADTSKGSDSFRTFASMQDATASRRPFLRVTYTAPTSSTQALAVAARAAGNALIVPTFAEPTSLLPAEAELVAAEQTPHYPDLGLSGDFDGDGRSDVATYRLLTSEWRIWTSGSNFSTAMQTVWGSAGDLPVPADYDGDRITDLAIYRPSTGKWHVWTSGSQTAVVMQWGGATDRPLALDHDGDGRADLALIRDGGYRILLSSTNYSSSVTVR